MSTDTGATWSTFNDGLTNLQVARLTSDGVYLYVGTLGSGVYRYGITTGLGEVHVQPIDITAYPVPCDASLTTAINVKASTELSAQMLDATGKLVAEQRAGRLPAGTHLLMWNTEALAPGLYTCRVMAGAAQGSLRLVRE